MPILTRRFGLSFLFLEAPVPRVLEDCGSEGGATFGVGFARSLRTLHFFVPLVTNTFSSFTAN